MQYSLWNLWASRRCRCSIPCGTCGLQGVEGAVFSCGTCGAEGVVGAVFLLELVGLKA